MTEKRWKTALVAISVSSAVLLLTIIARRERPLPRVAEEYSRALVNCDGRHLMNHTWEEEARANSYTSEKLERLCNELIKPVVQRFRRSEETTVQDNGRQAVAALPLRSSRGVPREFSVTMQRTGFGDKTSFSTKIVSAWVLSYELDKNLEANLESVLPAMAAGWKRDGPLLKSLGIRYWARENYETGEIDLVDFEALIDRNSTPRSGR